MLRAVLQHRSDVIRKEVSVRRYYATGETGAVRSSREMEGSRETCITLKFRRDPDVMAEVECRTTTAAIQRKSTQNVAIFWIESHVRIIDWDLHFRIVLRKGGGPKQENAPQKNRTS